MSLRGRDPEQHPSTINEYLDAYPDESFLDEPYDPEWPLTLRMAWLSRAAFAPASTSVAGGNSSSTPVPNLGTRAATPPRLRAEEPTQDVDAQAGSRGPSV